MGALCEKVIGETYKALMSEDITAAQTIMKEDNAIDLKERDIGEPVPEASPAAAAGCRRPEEDIGGAEDDH